MAISKEEALEKARQDLAQRLGIDSKDVQKISLEDKDFPDMALGAPIEDEMSGQMITRGWRIQLKAKGRAFEYRADGKQLRLVNFDGENYRI